MIETNNFKLTPDVYYKIFIGIHLSRWKWIYTGIILLSFVHLYFFGWIFSSIWLLAFGFCYFPLVAVIYYFVFTLNKKRLAYTNKYLAIDDTKLITRTESGVYSEIPLKNIIKTVDRKKYLLLFLDKTSFIYVLKAAFKTPDDMAEFIKKVTPSSAPFNGDMED